MSARNMGFRLTKPCSMCPWRTDLPHPFFGRDRRGYGRAQDLEQSLQDNHVFPCHKTAGFDDDGHQVTNGKTQACAGAIITMEKGEGSGNLLQIMERLGAYDPSILDMDSPVYGSLREWVQAHNPAAADASEVQS